MAPYAICSNDRCRYSFDFRGTMEGPTPLPPEFCPNCTARVLYFCRRCSHPIMFLNGAQTVECVFCDADVRTGKLFHRKAVTT
jgi:LSD1 subclass zinc finger protein